MFYSEEEKAEIREKWEKIYTSKCPICKGEGIVSEGNIKKLCKCKNNAMNSCKMELSNFPINNLNVKRDIIKKYIDYDFDNYFNVIINEVFKTKNLFLYNLSLDINDKVISYIGKKLISQKNTVTNKNIKIYYDIFENLIQLSLRSNTDKEARDKLNTIITYPNVLVIDSLGTETGFNSTSKHNVKLLNLILKERNNRVKSTIISSKLYFEEIEKYYNKEIVEMMMNWDIVKY